MEGNSLLGRSEGGSARPRKAADLADEEALGGWVDQGHPGSTVPVAARSPGATLEFDFGYKRVCMTRDAFGQAPFTHSVCLSACPCYYSGTLHPFRQGVKSRGCCLELRVLARTATFALLCIIVFTFILEIWIGGGIATLHDNSLVGPHKCALFVAKGNVSAAPPFVPSFPARAVDDFSINAPSRSPAVVHLPSGHTASSLMASFHGYSSLSLSMRTSFTLLSTRLHCSKSV